MIRVQLLGRFAIYTMHNEVVLPTAKVRQLAAYLFWQQGKWVSRNALRGMIWGEVDDSRAAGSLRTALHLLRRCLENSGIPRTILETRQDKVRIRSGYGTHIDTKIFEEKAREGLSGAASDIQPLIAAASIYSGNFLEDSNEEWCLIERRPLEDLYIAVLRTLVEHFTSSGIYQTALLYAHRWLARNQLDESAHQALIRLYGSMGQLIRSIEQFESCKYILKTELGILPSTSTLRLCDEMGLTTAGGSNSSKHEDLSSRNTLKTKGSQVKHISDDPLRNAGVILICGENEALKGNTDAAMRSLKEALDLYEKSGDTEDIARARLVIGSSLLHSPSSPDAHRALEYIAPAFKHYREQGRSSSLCRAMMLAAEAYWETGSDDRAVALAREGIELARDLNDKDAEARFSLVLGIALRDQYRLKESQAAFDVAVRLLTCFAEAEDILRVLYERALLALLMGELYTAERFLRETIATAGLVDRSTKVEQIDCLARFNLIYFSYAQDDPAGVAAICPVDELGKYSPRHLPYSATILLPSPDPEATINGASIWLRNNISKVTPYYILPTLVILVQQMIAIGMIGESAKWTSVAVRVARSKNWPGWVGVFYGYRATILAKLGRAKAANTCRKRAEDRLDEGDKWGPAWIAWADGLIAQLSGNDVKAKQHLLKSIDLFNRMGNKYHARQVKADMNALL